MISDLGRTLTQLIFPANHKQGEGKNGDWDYDPYDYYGEKDMKVSRHMCLCACRSMDVVGLN